MKFFLYLVSLFSLLSGVSVLADDTFIAKDCSRFTDGNPYHFTHVCIGRLGKQMALTTSVRNGPILLWKATSKRIPTPPLARNDLAYGSKFYTVTASFVSASDGKKYKTRSFNAEMVVSVDGVLSLA